MPPERELKYRLPDRAAWERLRALLGEPRETLAQLNWYFAPVGPPELLAALPPLSVRVRETEKLPPLAAGPAGIPAELLRCLRPPRVFPLPLRERGGGKGCSGAAAGTPSPCLPTGRPPSPARGEGTGCPSPAPPSPAAGDSEAQKVLTLTVKLGRRLSGAYHETEELEAVITASEWAPVRSGRRALTSLAAEPARRLAALGLAFHLVGGVTNLRLVYGPAALGLTPVGKEELDLDRTRYPDGSADQELEYETDDPARVAPALAELFRRAKVTAGPQTRTKHERFNAAYCRYLRRLAGVPGRSGRELPPPR